MPISESLELDLGPALSAIRGELRREIEAIPSTLREAFSDALTGIASDVGAMAELAREEIDRVLGAPIATAVEVDTGAVDEAVTAIDEAGHPIEAPVETDLTELDEAAAKIEELDGRTVTVDAAVDTSGLEAAAAQVDDVGTAAQQASVDMGGLSTAVGSVVSGVADLGRFTGTGGIFVGLTAAAVGFAHAAIEADTATRSFEARVGDLAPVLDRVDVAGLNEDLSEFAVRIGADDDGLRLALARFIQLGDESGRSRVELGQLGQELTSVSGYLSVLNPTLGTAEDIAGRLPQAFARGGRALTEFGLSISRAEIQQRALNDSGKASVEQLTQFDLAAAGLAITMERLGDKIATGIDKGVEAPAIKLRRLRTTIEETFESAGADLVDPFVHALETLTPVIADVALVAGKTAEGFASVLVPALEIVGPIVEDITGVLDHMPPVLLAAGAAAVLYARNMRAAAIASAEAATAGSAANASLTGGAGLAAKAAGAFAGIAAAQAIQSIAVDLKISSNAPKVTEEFAELAKVANEDVATAFAAVASGSFVNDLETGKFVLGVKNFGKTYRGEFRDLAEQSEGTARRVRNNLAEMGQDTTEFDKILNEMSESNEKAGQAAAASSDEIQAQIKALEAADPAARAAAASILHQSLAYELLTPEVRAAVDAEEAHTAAAQTLEEVTANAAKALEDQAAAAQAIATGFTNALSALQEYIGTSFDAAKQDLDFTVGLDKMKAKQDELIKSKGLTAAAFNLETAAGRENLLALGDQVKAQADLISKNIEAGESVEVATDRYRKQVDAIGKVAAATGLTKKQYDDYLAVLGLTPAEIGTKIELTGVPEAKTAADGVKTYIEALDPKVRARLTLDEVAFLEALQRVKDKLAELGPSSGDIGFAAEFAAGQIPTGQAYGGIVFPAKTAAAGGMNAGIYSSASGVMFNEPDAQGEAYVPFAMDRRERATRVLGETADRFGYALVPQSRETLSIPSSSAAAGGGGGGTAVLERIASLLDKLPERMPAPMNANIELTAEETDVLQRLNDRLRGR